MCSVIVVVVILLILCNVVFQALQVSVGSCVARLVREQELPHSYHTVAASNLFKMTDSQRTGSECCLLLCQAGARAAV